jgi:hypothetical protein
MHTAEVSSANAPRLARVPARASVPVMRESAAVRALDASDAPHASEIGAGRCRRLRAARTRRGAVLVEFALIAIAFYLLLAGTIELGRMIFAEQILQNAARVGARELALMPLPPTISFQDALKIDKVKATIFNQNLLCYDIPAGTLDQDLDNTTNDWPVVNRMLLPLMVREPLTIDGAMHDFLHFPGAVLHDANNPSLFIVGIPMVNDSWSSMTWLPVLQEVVPASAATTPTDAPFSMASTIPNHELAGLVALRINYPFQAAGLVQYRIGDVPNAVVVADDSNLLANGGSDATAVGGNLASPTSSQASIASYSGPLGLGALYANDNDHPVRPFRRLLTAQSIFRREVFGPPAPPPGH